MSYNDVPSGKNVPTDVNALIEIPKGGGHVKYEFRRESDIIFVDRLRDSAMVYPVNYGFIPQTLSEDGDPIDILVLCEHSIQTGTVIPARPIGVLIMEDEKGSDVKIIAVPADRLTSSYLHIQKLDDIRHEMPKIEHFFVHYKDLEGKSGKWSKVSGWEDAASAHSYILKAIEREKGREKTAMKV